MTSAPPEWIPASWRKKPAARMSTCSDAQALQASLDQLARLPPLVTSREVENLKGQLAGATCGERFMLQGGDCSESLAGCESDAIVGKLKTLLQMSLVLARGVDYFRGIANPIGVRIGPVTTPDEELETARQTSRKSTEWKSE
ncbi:MAG: 3-deoxy-7-phosphoheptulonate synthase [Deltaproteobacteria bacterium]|nr:3-deoxy-7-phosphoheptulonate synthase [Deltaproteobacteria bacterium]